MTFGTDVFDAYRWRKYFVPFIDNYYRCCKFYFRKQKSEVRSKFKDLKKIFYNECKQKVTRLRTDDGGG